MLKKYLFWHSLPFSASPWVCVALLVIWMARTVTNVFLIIMVITTITMIIMSYTYIYKKGHCAEQLVFLIVQHRSIVVSGFFICVVSPQVQDQGGVGLGFCFCWVVLWTLSSPSTLFCSNLNQFGQSWPENPPPSLFCLHQHSFIVNNRAVTVLSNLSNNQKLCKYLAVSFQRNKSIRIIGQIWGN